jgi:S1-C subfamily serine protease
MDNGKSHLRIADHCFCSDRSSIAIRWGIAIFVFACVAGSYPANSCADNREALLRKIKMATILIVADNGSQGSGVITYIRNKRYVLTAHHVVKGSKRIQLTSLGDRSTGEVTENEGWHVFYDLAAFRLPATMQHLPMLRLDHRRLPPGTTVFVSAFPKGVPTLTAGKITGYRFQANTDFPTEIAFTAPVEQGASGGMILDANGKIKGIVKAYEVLTSADGYEARGDSIGTHSYLIMKLILRAIDNGWRPK